MREEGCFNIHGKQLPTGKILLILTKLCIAKPPKIRSTVTFRKYRAIDLNDLSYDLLNSVPLQNPEGTLDERFEMSAIIKWLQEVFPIVSC
jgi:hypothetical protein